MRRVVPVAAIASTHTPAPTSSPTSSMTSSSSSSFFSPLVSSRRMLSHKDLFEGPMDLRPGEKKLRKGPEVAHSLPVYKTAHKLNHSIRWKTANLVTNVAGGKDYRLRETQGEGTFDETGMYRDWLYGDERRYANYVGCGLGAVAIFLFFYTMNVMGKETWDIPAPVLASQKKRVAREQALEGGAAATTLPDVAVNVGGAAAASDALAALKRPTTITKAA